MVLVYKTCLNIKVDVHKLMKHIKEEAQYARQVIWTFFIDSFG
jgi:hypothetical protein